MHTAARAWAGIDAGKGHHHVVVVDHDGSRLLSRRVANHEPDLFELVTAVLALADTIVWAVDLADGPAALVIAVLLQRRQKLVYLPGIAVNRATSGYRGEGKTDAKDAAVIADQARMRNDLRELRVRDEAIVELQMLTAHRADLAADRVRAINRLKGRLTGIFPALERDLDFTYHGPLVLISGFQTPDVIRELGAEQLEDWLRQRKVRRADKLAATAIQAATTQRTSVTGQRLEATLIARLATTVLELNQQLAEIDERIATRFQAHPQHEIITSMVGIGDLLGAEFLAAAGDTLSAFQSADHLAGYAGLAPAPRDSGRRTGNLHRPRRYNRQLQRVFYTSAQISIQHSSASKAFYDRKRAEGKRHRQAVLALARRRVNVLWAMLRDHHTYTEPAENLPIAA
jgi:transposase